MTFYQNFFEEQITIKKRILEGLKFSYDVQGRIVMCEFDATIVDGASESESEGLFDMYDLPPIDAWFYLEYKGNRNFLYAWIPDNFCTITERAIAVNAVDVLSWLK